MLNITYNSELDILRNDIKILLINYVISIIKNIQRNICKNNNTQKIQRQK